MRLRWLATAGLLFILAGVVALYFLQRQSPVPANRSTNSVANSANPTTPAAPQPTQLTFLTPELGQVERPAYVGPATCAQCHQKIHQTFSSTKHPRTLRDVRAEDMPDGFAASKNKFITRDSRIEFTLLRDENRFYQVAHDKSRSHDVTRSTMDLVLGAGGVGDDVFISWHDDGLMRELPIAWLYPTSEWATSHFDPNSSGDFARALTTRCVECHSTWVEHVPGTLNQYHREGRILGVTCEACHGPGGEHVQYHTANPQQTAGKHIVLPSHLERERKIEVCTQCHSNAIKHLGPAFSYRPGQRLDEHYKSLTASNTADDHVANQITYLRQSKCFINDSSMTCITCHNPHKASTAQTASASCLKCHQPDACLDRPNLPTQVRDDCSGCHMPSYLKININFQTQSDDYVPPLRRTEHRVAPYQYAKQEVLLKHYSQQTTAEAIAEATKLRQALVDHFQSEAARCRQDYRFLGAVAALREVVRLNDTPETRAQLQQAVQLQADLSKLATDAQRYLMENNSAAARATYQRLLSIKPDDSNALGRMGTEYARHGDRENAIKHWILVAKHDPNDAYGLGMLAWQAFLEGRFPEALDFYRKAEAIEPRQAKMKYQIGLVYTRMKNLPAAIDRFKQALEIEPQHAEALQAVVLASLDAGTAKDALPYAEHIVRLTGSQDPESLIMLARVYQAAGHPQPALTALRLALPLARTQATELVSTIEQQITALEAVR